MTPRVRDMAVRLAAAILRQDGHITLSEIEALPIVADEKEARLVAARLAELFNVSFTSRRTPGTLGGWDSRITLRDPGEVAAVFPEGGGTADEFDDDLRRVTRRVG